MWGVGSISFHLIFDTYLCHSMSCFIHDCNHLSSDCAEGQTVSVNSKHAGMINYKVYCTCGSHW